MLVSWCYAMMIDCVAVCLHRLLLLLLLVASQVQDGDWGNGTSLARSQSVEVTGHKAHRLGQRWVSLTAALFHKISTRCGINVGEWIVICI